MRNVLVISNGVFCETDNNGKTLLNLFKDIPKSKVAQLYFYGDEPKVVGYRYFQLSNLDVVKGKLSRKYRGRAITPVAKKGVCVGSEQIVFSQKRFIKRNIFTLCVRELLWKDSWYSKQLEDWLNKIKPGIIFFMAGDAIFAYDITEWIAEKYSCKLFTYVTDDYIIERSKETFLEKLHRATVRKKMMNFAHKSECFFTICEKMRQTYREVLGVDSKILINRCEQMYDRESSCLRSEDEKIVFIYAGSLYYGRDKILLELAKVLKKINDFDTLRKQKTVLNIYLNKSPDKRFLAELDRIGVGEYKGRLKPEELRCALNRADFPVFVESFDVEQVEKIRLSFSTKVTEYLSLMKPILAIGPENVGSMDCFKDTAICANHISDIYKAILLLLNDHEMCDRSVMNAKKKYDELMNYPRLLDYMESL